MNKYEVMFIVRPDMEEAEIKKTADHNLDPHNHSYRWRRIFIYGQ